MSGASGFCWSGLFGVIAVVLWFVVTGPETFWQRTACLILTPFVFLFVAVLTEELRKLGGGHGKEG